ncbi:hypothetical protein [Alteromonas gracilis]|uniref:hypothetical protein n=1 Tax=Alteromonas gracilis TaxID=1479524 RepID=UPI003736CDFC
MIDTMEARHPIFKELADVEALKALASELKSNALLPMTRRQVFNHIGQLTPLFRDRHSIT